MKKIAKQKSPIGAFLKQKRMAARLSQQDVAKSLRYTTPQFISNWERNVSFPPKQALKVLTRKYNLSSEDLDTLKKMYIEKHVKELEDLFVF